jgi:drug/metabolite transporter (DMT)-like permease
MGVTITLAAAMLLGVGFVLQQHAAEQAPKALFLRLRLITSLLPQRRWLVGVGVMVTGQLCSAWSVSHLALSLAEPMLATSLLFALALAVPLSGQRLRAVEVIGAVVLAGGVAALSVARDATNTPAASFASPAGWLAAAAIAAVAAGFVHVGRLRSGQARATLTGAAAGLVFGISDALTRQTVLLMDSRPLSALLTSWPGYSLVGASLLGLWLMESAFSASQLHTSLPAISAAEPAAGIVLGVMVFGDTIKMSPVMIATQLAGVIALVTGVILVARAPVLRDLRRRSVAALAHAAPQHGTRTSGEERAPAAGDGPGPATERLTAAGPVTAGPVTAGAGRGIRGVVAPASPPGRLDAGA